MSAIIITMTLKFGGRSNKRGRELLSFGLLSHVFTSYPTFITFVVNTGSSGSKDRLNLKTKNNNWTVI